MKSLKWANNLRPNNSGIECYWLLFIHAILVFPVTGFGSKDEGSRQDVSLLVFPNASPSHQELQAEVVYRAMPY
jgi:hypothetical protein